MADFKPLAHSSEGMTDDQEPYEKGSRDSIGGGRKSFQKQHSMSTMDEDSFQTAMQASQTNRKSIKVTFENLNYSVKINSTK